MARQSGRTVRAILGVGEASDPISTIELLFWEAYDKLEPMGSDVLMIAKVVAAIKETEDPYTYVPARSRSVTRGDIGSREQQRRVASTLQGFANMLADMFGVEVTSAKE